MCHLFFFFNDTATTEIYTLSLHDALPIYRRALEVGPGDENVTWNYARFLLTEFDDRQATREVLDQAITTHPEDRKSTRLNSSHANISYAVFCLKKKKPS